MKIAAVAVSVSVIALLAAGCERLTPPGEEEAVPARPAAKQPLDGRLPANTPIGYACESGETITVRYPSANAAELAYRGQRYAMSSAQTEDGARFAGDGLEWWVRTVDAIEEATLRRGAAGAVGAAVLERCVRPAALAGPPALAPEPSATTPAAGPSCRTADLSASQLSSDAGAGSRGHVIALTNRGTRACTLEGRPAVALLDGAGRRLTQVRSEDSARADTAEAVTLEPGEQAVFDVIYSGLPTGSETCPVASRVQVTPPGDTASLTVTARMQPCGGRIQVTPLREEAAAETGSGTDSL